MPFEGQFQRVRMAWMLERRKASSWAVPQPCASSVSTWASESRSVVFTCRGRRGEEVALPLLMRRLLCLGPALSPVPGPCAHKPLQGSLNGLQGRVGLADRSQRTQEVRTATSQNQGDNLFLYPPHSPELAFC